MDDSHDLFKIKSINGKDVVSADKRKLISPFNSTKHFKSANIPALCDQCVYRSVEDGGNGKCPKYEAGAVCAIREDFLKFINEIDTRNPEDIKAMMDMIAKISFENVLMALTQAKMDGNIPLPSKKLTHISDCVFLTIIPFKNSLLTIKLRILSNMIVA